VKARPYLFLLALALVWGLHWPVAKVGLQYLPPLTYSALRAVGGLLTLVVLLAWRGGLRLPDRRDLPVVVSMGLGMMAAGFVLMNLALEVVQAGRSSILYYTLPLWVALMQFPRLLAGGVARQLVGLAIGLFGMALLLNPWAIDWGASGELIGSAGLILSAVIAAAVTIHVRHHVWHGTPLSLEPWQLLLALVPVTAAALLLEGGRPIDWQPTAVGTVLYSGVLATALAYWMSQSIARALTPLATTMGLLAVPVVGLTSSALLLGEPLTLMDVAGAAVTFVGIAIVSLASTDGPPPLDPAAVAATEAADETAATTGTAAAIGRPGAGRPG
jgi:drug/metabolite transporter (DMT)-like permease